MAFIKYTRTTGQAGLPPDRAFINRMGTEISIGKSILPGAVYVFLYFDPDTNQIKMENIHQKEYGYATLGKPNSKSNTRSVRIVSFARQFGITITKRTDLELIDCEEDYVVFQIPKEQQLELSKAS